VNQPGPTVYAIDDDPSVLRGMERLLRSAGYTPRMFASAEAFFDQYDREATGCLILDLAMPGFDGMQVQQRLNQEGCVLPIIFLTGHGDVATSVRAMKNGAADFHTKPVDDRELLSTVEQAIRRCQLARQQWRERADITARFATLTAREREVLAHLLAGQRNKQIAAALGTVEKTIKVHRARIMHKTQSPSLAALIRLAERAGITHESAG
jgi:FixJ family two-component response regulator